MVLLSKNRAIMAVLAMSVAVLAFAAIVLLGSEVAYAKGADAIAPGKSLSANSVLGAEADLAASKKMTGLSWQGDGLYYLHKGKKVRRAWKRVGGKKYYFGKDGKAVWGIRKIYGKCYLFSEDGSLRRFSKNKLIERDDDTYYVTKTGQLLTGWQLYRNKLYHFSSRGKMDTDMIIDHVKIDENGKTDSSKAAKAKILALKIVNRVAPLDASRSEKLRAAWNYLVSRKHFRYRAIYPDQTKKNWQYDTAHYMLKNRAGNCFSFACAFAQMAQVIGYEPDLVLARIHGSRDHARDGFTRHSWVKINNRCYDPELRFASGYHIYGASAYPMSTKNVKIRKF